jgi:hypothetical protein
VLLVDPLPLISPEMKVGVKIKLLKSERISTFGYLSPEMKVGVKIKLLKSERLSTFGYLKVGVKIMLPN